MAQPLKKVLSGEAFNVGATTWNAMIEAAIAHRNRQLDGRGNVIRKSTDTGIILVRNDSGSDVGRFAVLGIDSIVFGPGDNLPEFQNNPALSCITPSTADSSGGGDHTGKFVITAEPILDGHIGRAFISGVCPVQIDDVGEFADVKDGDDSQLHASDTGSARVLYVDSSSSDGPYWAIVLLGVGGSGKPIKLVRIDGHADLYSKTIQWGNSGTAASTVVAWTYTGVECRLDTSSPDGSVVAVDGGQAFSATGAGGLPKLYNPHEWSATTAIVGGIEVDSDNFPATAGDATTHRYRPLDAAGTSMSHAWTPIVWATTSVNSDGQTIWVIVSPRNRFDGACG